MTSSSKAACLISLFVFTTAPTVTNALNLNYESLSSLEEPIAVHIGDTTLVWSGLVDLPLTFDLEDHSGSESGFRSNMQLSAETQLSNSWTLGAAYSGSYADDLADTYDDNAALFVGGIWGVLSIGNVNGVVREETRRNRGVGNAILNYDDFLGSLEDEGIAYSGRFGPSRLSFSVDEDDNTELGWMYQRPFGNKDYRFSARFQSAEFTTDDGVEFDTQGFGIVAELTYGSNVFDIGINHETLKAKNISSVDRWFVSSGVNRKVRRWTISGEILYGEVENQQEQSYALGIAYDVARGISLNLGVNYRNSNIELDRTFIRNEKATEGVLSLRYSF